MSDHLYGQPDAEHMEWDPASVWEAGIEPHWSDDPDVDGRGPWTIEKWTTHPPSKHLPSIGHLVDYISEWVADSGEVDEGGAEDFADAVHEARPWVDLLMVQIASRVAYRMADKKVGEHVITLDENDEPLIDGKPMYRKVQL